MDRDTKGDLAALKAGRITVSKNSNSTALQKLNARQTLRTVRGSILPKLGTGDRLRKRVAASNNPHPTDDGSVVTYVYRVKATTTTLPYSNEVDGSRHYDAKYQGSGTVVADASKHVDYPSLRQSIQSAQANNKTLHSLEKEMGALLVKAEPTYTSYSARSMLGVSKDEYKKLRAEEMAQTEGLDNNGVKPVQVNASLSLANRVSPHHRVLKQDGPSAFNPLMRAAARPHSTIGAFGRRSTLGGFNAQEFANQVVGDDEEAQLNRAVLAHLNEVSKRKVLSKIEQSQGSADKIMEHQDVIQDIYKESHDRAKVEASKELGKFQGRADTILDKIDEISKLQKEQKDSLLLQQAKHQDVADVIVDNKELIQETVEKAKEDVQEQITKLQQDRQDRADNIIAHADDHARAAALTQALHHAEATARHESAQKAADTIVSSTLNKSEAEGTASADTAPASGAASKAAESASAAEAGTGADGSAANAAVVAIEAKASDGAPKINPARVLKKSLVSVQHAAGATAESPSNHSIHVKHHVHTVSTIEGATHTEHRIIIKSDHDAALCRNLDSDLAKSEDLSKATQNKEVSSGTAANEMIVATHKDKAQTFANIGVSSSSAGTASVGSGKLHGEKEGYHHARPKLEHTDGFGAPRFVSSITNDGLEFDATGFNQNIGLAKGVNAQYIDPVAIDGVKPVQINESSDLSHVKLKSNLTPLSKTTLYGAKSGSLAKDDLEASVFDNRLEKISGLTPDGCIDNGIGKDGIIEQNLKTIDVEENASLDCNNLEEVLEFTRSVQQKQVSDAAYNYAKAMEGVVASLTEQEATDSGFSENLELDKGLSSEIASAGFNLGLGIDGVGDSSTTSFKEGSKTSQVGHAINMAEAYGSDLSQILDPNRVRKFDSATKEEATAGFEALSNSLRQTTLPGFVAYDRPSGKIYLDHQAAYMLGIEWNSSGIPIEAFLINFSWKSRDIFHKFANHRHDHGDTLNCHVSLINGPMKGNVYHFTAGSMMRAKDGTAIYMSAYFTFSSEEIKRAVPRSLGDDGSWEWDGITGEAHFSETYLKMLGYSSSDKFPKTLDEWIKTIVHPDDVKDSITKQRQIILSPNQGDTFESCMRLRHKDGHYIWTLVRGIVLGRDQHGRAYRISGTNTNLKLVKERTDSAKIISYTDHLTGVYNRAYLEKHHKIHAKPENQPLFCVFADVTGLKLVNDNLGHEAGNDLIRLTVRALNKAFSMPHDTFRLGGDEFLLLIPKCNVAKLKMMQSTLDALCLALRETGELPLMIGCGMASLAEAHGNVFHMISIADKRAQEVKRRKHSENYNYLHSYLENRLGARVQKSDNRIIDIDAPQ